MSFATLSDPNLRFYVPSFVVRLGKKSLTHELGLAVSSAEVDLTLSAASRFSFTVVNAYDDAKRAFVSVRGEALLLDLAALGRIFCF